MTARRQRLRERIASGQTTWAAGAYDALSAKLIAEAGFDAVFTSGLCVSAAYLGAPDAELYTMSENLDVLRRVAAAVEQPVVADGDTGYGNAINVMRTVREFEAAGAAGIVFEDQVSPKRCPASAARIDLLPLEEACGKIRAAVVARRDPALVIAARTDALDPAQAIRRARAYAQAGADLVQPISRSFDDADGLIAMRAAAGVPLSLQIVGWLEDRLTREQIERIAGLAVFPVVPLTTAVAALRANLSALRRDLSTAGLPMLRVDHRELNHFLGFDEIEARQRQFLSGA